MRSLLRSLSRSCALALGLVVLLPACSATDSEPDPVWQRADLDAPNDRLLWKVALRACDKMSFPLGSGLDPSAMIIETGWRTNLQPFRGEGSREKAELRFTPIESGVWSIEARVKRQRNMALAQPLDPRYADWEWVSDDVATARLLVQHVRSYLQPSIDPVDRPDDPVEAYLQQHGLGDS